MVHLVCARRKERRGGGLCGISKSEMLASECDPQGKRRGTGRAVLVVGLEGVARGGRRGARCGSRRGKGRDLPQDLVSHRLLLQHYNKMRAASTSEAPVKPL